MAGYNLPSKWRLWHPNQGVIFAPNPQPLYPILDIARFFSNASPVQESQTMSGVPEGVKTTNLVHRTHSVRRKIDVGQGHMVEEKTTTTSTAKITLEKSVSPALEEETAKTEGEAEDGKSPESEEDVSSGPPYTPLDFKIPDEIFRAASLAAPGTPESFWTYGFYRGPGDDGETESKVKVHYCRSKHTMERVLQYFLNEKVIGLDLEWSTEATKNSGPRKNVSLIQIASQSRIALFHLALFPKNDELVTPTLKKIIEDPEITKCGVWIKGDCTRLRKWLDIQARGIFELSHLFKQVKHSKAGEHELIDKRFVSLANQTQEVLQLPMFKGQDVRASDWSQPLAMGQIIYSASDAYAAVQIFAMLNHQRENLDPVPPLPYHAELNRPIPLADGANIPTSDENESVTEFDPNNEDSDSTTLPQEYLKLAGEDIQVEAEADIAEPSLPQTPKPRKAAAAKDNTRPKDPRVAAAEKWLVEYRTKVPCSRAPLAAMRAYHIWHADETLGPEAVAQVLRDPPLAISTVVGYILESIKIEKLPYDSVRLQTEVLGVLPREVVEKRYKTLLKAASLSQA